MIRRPAVFLDRDGVVIEDVNFLSRIEQVRLLPEAAQAIKRLNESGFVVVIVTNQSGVARGYFDEASVRATHVHLQELLAAEGARIDRFYFCPHHPNVGAEPYRTACECRKPRPGMLLSATQELELDLGESWMIGDRQTDVEAGLAAGCRAVLVQSNLVGWAESSRPTNACQDGVPRRLGPPYKTEDLWGAVEIILQDSAPR